ncbi:hypothetical protein BHM03_00006450 [Ensete ventricosum]|nr:hypothetical protein BHM03_00006450 [Ensete ventricosum]
MEQTPLFLRNSYWVLRHGKSVPNEKGLIVSSLENGTLEKFGLASEGFNQARLAGELLLKAMLELRERYFGPSFELLSHDKRNRPSAVDFGRRQLIEGKIDRRWSIEGEKGKKKKKRKRRKKKKRRRKKTSFPRVVVARVSSLPTRHPRPWANLLPREETERLPIKVCNTMVTARTGQYVSVRPLTGTWATCYWVVSLIGVVFAPLPLEID